MPPFRGRPALCAGTSADQPFRRPRSGGCGLQRRTPRLLAHVPWTEAEHRITAINADPATAKKLEAPESTACLALERWTWRGEERITYARQLYPGDRYALTAHFHA
ncbi:UTRA domain-containing protein [Sphingobium chlorophenolicum]|nr:UTRA domain-containing protein [Sphingobium chlorophenolicum]